MSNVTSFRVTGDWRHIVDDGMVDVDDLPDEVLPTGTVKFRPLYPTVATAGVPATAYTFGTVPALIAGGVLTDLQGREGLRLVGKVGEHTVRWSAEIELTFQEQKVPYPSPVAFELEADTVLSAIIQQAGRAMTPIVLDPRVEALAGRLAEADELVQTVEGYASDAAGAVGLAKAEADRAIGLAGAQDEHIAGTLSDPTSATHAAFKTVGNATYVPAGLAASKRSKLSQIAVPRDSTGATGNAARLQFTGHAPSASPRGIGTDGAMYMIRLENTMWRSYDGMSTWEQGATFTPYTVALYAGGGTFTLTAGGQTTAPFTRYATAAEVKTALEGLSSVGVGNVSVWSDPQLSGSRTGYSILFKGAASALTLTGTSNLTGAPAPQFVIQREKMLYVNRTSSGYVIFMLASQNPVWPAGHLTVWHTTNFTTAADLQLVLTCNSTTLTGFAVPRHVNGDTWLLFGEYRTAQYPSIPAKRFLSTDGGLTWTLVRTHTPTDTSVNCHSHTGLIESTGRIWVSDGDQVNAWYGYSDDKGKTWVPVKTDPDSEAADPGGVYQQPTVMIDFTADDRLSVSPDRGSFKPGMWDTDASTRETTTNFGLPGLYELTPGNGDDAAAQYGHPMYAQDGRTAYVMFADTGSGSKTTHIAATGDWGRTWWLVASIPYGTGSLSAGIYGPDLNGRLFMQGTNLPTFSSGVISAPVLKWDWQILPSE